MDRICFSFQKHHSGGYCILTSLSCFVWHRYIISFYPCSRTLLYSLPSLWGGKFSKIKTSRFAHQSHATTTVRNIHVFASYPLPPGSGGGGDLSPPARKSNRLISLLADSDPLRSHRRARVTHLPPCNLPPALAFLDVQSSPSVFRTKLLSTRFLFIYFFFFFRPFLLYFFCSV